MAQKDIAQKLLDDYISDYRINVVEVAWLDDETISKFTSDFRIVADFFVQRRKNKDYQPYNVPYKVDTTRERDFLKC